MSFIKTKTLKKAISTLTMISTVVWLSGISMFAVSIDVASAAITDGALISSNATNSDGTPTLASLDVYIVKLVGAEQFKRLILNPTVFTSYGHLKWSDVQEVSQAVMDSYTTSSLVRVDTDATEKVFAMAPDGDIGSKSWVNLTTAQATSVTGYDADSVYTINSTDGSNYNTVDDITTTTQLTTFYSTGALPGVTPVPAGGLVLSLSSSTPSAGNIARDVDNVIFTKLNFTASSEGDVKVNSIGIHRTGLGSDTDFASVTLYDGGTKLGSTKTTFNSSHKMVFNLGTGWTIPAGTTKTLTVKAKVDTAGTYNALGIAAATDVVVASGTVSGDYPVYGNQMSAVTVSALGAVTIAPSAITDQTKKIGETGILLADFNLTASSNEDLTLCRINLKNIGTAKDTSISNVTLKKGTDVLAEGLSMVSDYVNIDFSSKAVTIAKGTTAYFKLYGDIADVDTTTVEFNLRADTDIEVVGAVYGYNVTLTRSAFDAVGESITTTIDGSELNISLTSVNADSPADVDNVELGRINLSSGKDVKITDIIFTID